MITSLWEHCQLFLNNIEGQRPIRVSYSEPFVADAIQKANIDIDTKIPNWGVNVFISQDGRTTYELGGKVGECEDFLKNSNLRRKSYK